MAVSVKFLLVVCCAALNVILCSAAAVTDTTPSGTDGATDAAISSGNDDSTAAVTTTTEASTTTAASTAAVTTTSEASTTTAASTAAVTTTTEASTTTAAPQPPYNCYDCNSGNVNTAQSLNENCNRNGTNIISQLKSCPTYCFTQAGEFSPAGTVTRGCADGFWLEGYTLGCQESPHSWDKKWLCLCEGDMCNNDDLESKADEYYFNQTSGVEASGSNSVL